MFMSAGLMYAAVGHDRIAGLTGVGRLLPMTVGAFALGGVSLIGLPPSGGFLAKWLLIEAAVVAGQWWWVVTMLAGGLLTSGYMFLVLVRTMTPAHEPLTLEAAIPRYQQAAALALALCSLLLGLVAFSSFDAVQIGRPAGALIGLR
jgi:formate hydrogenlyase subunit 3/multisubunit Na+/H+ antiporter MnhD subunit